MVKPRKVGVLETEDGLPTGQPAILLLEPGVSWDARLVVLS